MSDRRTSRPILGPEARAAEVRRLLDSYPESPLPSLPTTPAQWASSGELTRLVLAARLPLAPADRGPLEAAVAAVRATWPKDACELAGSTLHTLLTAAQLMLGR